MDIHKPDQDQFHAYVSVQYSGLTNMFDADRVIELALSGVSKKLTKDNIVYIMRNYQALVEEYGTGQED